MNRPAASRGEGRPRVAVVVCTWHGVRHLGEQLDSIARQSWPVSVYVHDDASGDGTPDLARSHPVVDEVIAHAVNAGFVGNFERGIGRALVDGFDYIALSDQDDVWAPSRIARTMAMMLEGERRHGCEVPSLVHSDLSIVDAHGATLHDSYLSRRGYAIGERAKLALILGQNGVMGNTVLMNRALAELALPFPTSLHVHDWWFALLAELYGERRLVPEALVAYRTHALNASNPAGSIAPSAFAIVRRLTWRRLLKRDFRLPFLEDSRHLVLDALLAGDGHRPPPDGEARRLIEDFLAYLRLERPRLTLLVLLLRGGFLRRAPLHRLRVALALLTSRRYRATRPGRRTAPLSAARRRGR